MTKEREVPTQCVSGLIEVRETNTPVNAGEGSYYARKNHMIKPVMEGEIPGDCRKRCVRGD